jgi:hypothetical protein
MNPFDFIETVAAAVEQSSFMALCVAAVGGVLSTST